MSTFKNLPHYHTAIIGAGASGLFCAGGFSAQKIILDHNSKPGEKLRISGGGRCNFSNLYLTENDYVGEHPHFCHNALQTFKPHDFINLLKQYNVRYEECDEGKLFAKNARDILDFLITRAKEANTQFELNTQALSVEKEKDGSFTLQTSNGPLSAQHVVLASGGLSYPSIGASSFGIQVARHFNLPIVAQRPALCGLVLPKILQERFCVLAGNAIPAQIYIGKHTFTGPILFTHEGLSGPVVLQASLFVMPMQEVKVNFLPQHDALQLLRAQKNSPKKPSQLFAEILSPKITKTILGPLLERDISNATKHELTTIAQLLNSFSFIPHGTFGYTKAEVTAGGIDTQAINPQTMECKNIPGLYITGELLDVTGRLGGFNLHWAWASGYMAAQALSKIF